MSHAFAFDPTAELPPQLRAMLPEDQVRMLDEHRAAAKRYEEAAYAAALEARRFHLQWAMIFCTCHRWPGQCRSRNPAPQHDCIVHGALFTDDEGNPVV